MYRNRNRSRPYWSAPVRTPLSGLGLPGAMGHATAHGLSPLSISVMLDLRLEPSPTTPPVGGPWAVGGAWGVEVEATRTEREYSLRRPKSLSLGPDAVVAVDGRPDEFATVQFNLIRRPPLGRPFRIVVVVRDHLAAAPLAGSHLALDTRTDVEAVWASLSCAARLLGGPRTAAVLNHLVVCA